MYMRLRYSSMDNSGVDNSKMLFTRTEDVHYTERIMFLKKDKMLAKSAFIKSKFEVCCVLNSASRRELITRMESLIAVEEQVTSIFMTMLNVFVEKQDLVSMQSVIDEMEELESDFKIISSRAEECLSSTHKIQDVVDSQNTENESVFGMCDKKQSEIDRKDWLRQNIGEQSLQMKEEALNSRETKDTASTHQGRVQHHSEVIGCDMWSQLKRIAIPTFSGNKNTYQGWKTAFTACIDQSSATPEYKLLQLRQYLSGEALQCIEKLGHSAAAYQIAKETLERKFGGKRRQVAIHLEELEQFQPVRDGYAKDLELFADLLDTAILRLSEEGREEDLGNGVLYAILQRKLTEGLLVKYHRWIHDKQKMHSVMTLREWVMQESEFQIIGYETVRGVSSGVVNVIQRQTDSSAARSSVEYDDTLME